MTEVYDILLDDDGDLKIENGDLVIGESTLQHQGDILMAVKGDYKIDPLIGVGLINFFKDDEAEDLGKEIVSQFEMDGININQITGSGMTTKIDAEYK